MIPRAPVSLFGRMESEVAGLETSNMPFEVIRNLSERKVLTGLRKLEYVSYVSHLENTS